MLHGAQQVQALVEKRSPESLDSLKYCEEITRTEWVPDRDLAGKISVLLTEPEIWLDRLVEILAFGKREGADEIPDFERTARRQQVGYAICRGGKNGVLKMSGHVRYNLTGARSGYAEPLQPIPQRYFSEKPRGLGADDNSLCSDPNGGEYAELLERWEGGRSELPRSVVDWSFVVVETQSIVNWLDSFAPDFSKPEEKPMSPSIDAAGVAMASVAVAAQNSGGAEPVSERRRRGPKSTVEKDASMRTKINIVIRMATQRSKEGQLGLNEMANFIRNQTATRDIYSLTAIKRILTGKYAPMKRLGICAIKPNPWLK